MATRTVIAFAQALETDGELRAKVEAIATRETGAMLVAAARLAGEAPRALGNVIMKLLPAIGRTVDPCI